MRITYLDTVTGDANLLGGATCWKCGNSVVYDHDKVKACPHVCPARRMAQEADALGRLAIVHGDAPAVPDTH